NCMRYLSDKKRDSESRKVNLKRVVIMAERGEASSRQGREGRQVLPQDAATQE
ncbi:hypothetical protein KI387_000138, partial [Taxus chinensis]